MTPVDLVTLTPQQLSYATAMVRWPTSGCRDVIDYLRAHTVDDPDLPEGEPIALLISPAQLAANIGASAHTVIGAFRKLVSARVVFRLRPAEGSMPPMWFLNGELSMWKVDWRVDRALALSKVASLITYAPYGAQVTEFSCAPYGAQQTVRTTAISCLAFVHRGPFVARHRARSYGYGSYAHKTAQQISAMEARLSSLLVPTEPSSKQQEESIDITSGVAAVLSAFAEVTGHPAHDGKHPIKSSLIAAVAPLDDAGFIVAELRRMGRPLWKEAFERVLLLAAQGPPAAPPRSGPAEFVSDDVHEPADPTAAAAALEAARSVLRPGATCEDVG